LFSKKLRLIKYCVFTKDAMQLLIKNMCSLWMDGEYIIPKVTVASSDLLDFSN